MVLDYKAIEQAVKQETSTANFPELIQKLKAMGIRQYDYYVEKGLYRYYDQYDYIEIPMNGRPRMVATYRSPEGIKRAVEHAKSGTIGFDEFCREAGQAGISFWVTDLAAMTVTYCDATGESVWWEKIPEV